MGRKKNKPFMVMGIYDTETTNVYLDGEWVAYPVLYICNDVSQCDLYSYRPDDRNERVSFFRDEQGFLGWLRYLIDLGTDAGVIPVVAGYNLMFDLKPVMADLSASFEIRPLAQSSTSAYTVDLLGVDGNPVLRFWDTFYLEMNGLAAMGRVCGLPKSVGDWDYSLTRTPETPITETELGYAKRDVQVIPAYLRYLLESNDWLQPEMLGSRVLTKTSLVRRMAENEVGGLRPSPDWKCDLRTLFSAVCKNDRPKTYDQYALRKACFRGGLTFTAANFAGQVVSNVTKVDVVSMHHTFISRFQPQRFCEADLGTLQKCTEDICETSVDYVLRHYERPFSKAINARVCFKNLKLREGSAFELWGIACLSSSKFTLVNSSDEFDNELNSKADESVKRSGYRDVAFGAEFAFGKLISAECCLLHLTELELWNVSQVYQWDSMEVLDGEMSVNYRRPPDYVALQSHMLFERKSAMKWVCGHYRDGQPLDVPERFLSAIPDGLLSTIKDGTADSQFLESYYTSTVKGMFNGIYGCQAQNQLKPSYRVNSDGDFEVDPATIARPDNWDDVQPRRWTVLYTYGTRIVGGSRMHLILAIELLHRRFGGKVTVTGGDTDSLLIARNDPDISPGDIAGALEPIARASKKSIDLSCKRMRQEQPGLSSSLDRVGAFDIEVENYPLHMDAWNKARISLDEKGVAHITLAGVSRPRRKYNLESLAMHLLAKGWTFDDVAHTVLGYNVEVAPDLSHILGHTEPSASDTIDADITDYLGNVSHVSSHRSIALHPSSKVIGDTSASVNFQNVQYLKKIGRNVDTRRKILTCGKVYLVDGFEIEEME